MNYIVQMIRDIARFHRGYPEISAMTIALITLFAIPAGRMGLITVPILTTLIVSELILALVREEKARQDRITAPGGGALLDVLVNGVKVGRILDSQYAAIQRKVARDHRVYVKQILNALKGLMRVADYLFVALPITAVWIFVVGYVFFPSELRFVVSAAKTITPADAVAAIPMVLMNLFAMGAVVVFIHAALGLSRFGFVHQGYAACDDLVRRFVKCAVKGDVKLRPCEQMVTQEELRTILLSDSDKRESSTELARRLLDGGFAEDVPEEVRALMVSWAMAATSDEAERWAAAAMEKLGAVIAAP